VDPVPDPSVLIFGVSFCTFSIAQTCYYIIMYPYVGSGMRQYCDGENIDLVNLKDLHVFGTPGYKNVVYLH
jgi:hypothetical protein